jgi:hypothetical protein
MATLIEVIEFLEQQDARKVLPHGFKRPHSYRGYYEKLAFEPAENVSIGDMWECAKFANGREFSGYKGGEYLMGDYTDVYLANYGECGESLSLLTLKSMIYEQEQQQQAALLTDCLSALEKASGWLPWHEPSHPRYEGERSDAGREVRRVIEKLKEWQNT